ncbi:hypothetical protein [Protaetiibacter intestinalis]|uniref:DUF2975 domain-containing protein n=1 Tax=Protaetiibacter intestinalis TaxID=2419774 RepID=A0A387B7D4_9MICO|nr:hypothetical protein [Protaetiibacter intestinalis]AYF97658.1 hypothetical protein D7I47_04880 [Protaetiibacter intestinalis]
METTSAPAEVSRVDRVAIWLILAIGALGGGFIAGLGFVTAVFRILDPARYPVSLLADVPVDGGPGIVQVHGDSIVVNADGLAPGTVWALAAGDFFEALTIALVTASFAYVLWRVAQRRPFHRTVQAAALVAGFSLALGGILSQGIGGLGQMMAATDLEPTLGDIVMPGFLFTPTPFVVGFGVMALAYVFRTGTRLQRETEGLV